MDNMNYDRNNPNGAVQPQSPYNGQPIYTEPERPTASASTPGKAIASLLLGIASIAFTCTGILSLICSIIGLVLSSQLKREVQEMPGVGKAGKVLNIIGLVLGILGILFWLILILFGDWKVNY